MRKVVWTTRARGLQREWLEYLSDIDPDIAARALEESEAALDRLARRSLPGRSSRWRGLREWPLTDWHKIVVFELREEEVVVRAIFDMRQDLTRVRP